MAADSDRGYDVDLRVSVLPTTANGLSCVRRKKTVLNLSEMGFSQIGWDHPTIIHLSHGIISDRATERKTTTFMRR
jgi:hypothetical protein